MNKRCESPVKLIKNDCSHSMPSAVQLMVELQLQNQAEQTSAALKLQKEKSLASGQKQEQFTANQKAEHTQSR